MDDIQKDIYVQFPENRKVYFGMPLVIVILFAVTFCVSFGSGVLSAVSTMYMMIELKYTPLEMKELVHSLIAVRHIMNIFGVILSDNWFGYYYPPLVGLIILALAKILMALGTFHSLNLPARLIFFISLTIMYIAGAISALTMDVLLCDQFILPDESKSLTLFFFISYYLDSITSIFADIVGPMVRTMHCFGADTCFPPLFISSAVCIIVYSIMFVCIKKMFILKRPQKNILGRTACCIFYAGKQYWKLHKTEKKANCLDYAEDKYEQIFIDKIKTIFRIFIVILPLIIVNTLNAQQGTSWLYTRSRLNGDIGFMTVLPDQVEILNPLLVLCCLPLVKNLVIPFFERRNFITKLLQKMAFGVFFMGAAFVAMGCLQFQVEALDPVLPKKGEAQLRMYNSIPCDVTVTGDGFSTVIPGLDVYENKTLEIHGTKTIAYTFSTDESCSEAKGSKELSVNVSEKGLVGIHLGWNSTGIVVNSFKDAIKKNENGRSNIRQLVSANDQNKTTVKYYSSNNKKQYARSAMFQKAKEMDAMEYTLKIDGNVVGKIRTRSGGVYVILISYKDPSTPKFNSVIITPENTIHIAWVIIPYFLLIVGDLFYMISANEFYYTQAPRKMKGVVQCIPQIKVALGNLLIVIVEQLGRVIHSQAILYMIYTMLLYVGLVIFLFLQRRFKYAVIIPEEEEEREAQLERKQKEEATKK